MIEIYLLEHLLAVSECGTLSDAAEKLNIAQPSVSRAMKKLESELGVKLFERTKNKITLNETGKLAAEYARRIIETEKEMQRHIAEFEKQRNTISIGSIAPGPLMILLPSLAGSASEYTIATQISDETDLMGGLSDSRYNLLIMNRPIENNDVICKKYISEHLYITVNHFHPAAVQKEITFSEMNGQNFIMYAKVGFWEDIVKSEMPDSKFYKQDDMDAVGELSCSSNLPSFSTDITQSVIQSRNNGRINIPLTDKKAYTQYYLVYMKNDKKKFDKLL